MVLFSGRPLLSHEAPVQVQRVYQVEGLTFSCPPLGVVSRGDAWRLSRGSLVLLVVPSRVSAARIRAWDAILLTHSPAFLALSWAAASIRIVTVGDCINKDTKILLYNVLGNKINIWAYF